jgi:hypothetical protein
LPEVGLRFNVVLIFAVFKVFLHNGENPLNCSAASSALVGSKLTGQATHDRPQSKVASSSLACRIKDGLVR